MQAKYAIRIFSTVLDQSDFQPIKRRTSCQRSGSDLYYNSTKAHENRMDTS